MMLPNKLSGLNLIAKYEGTYKMTKLLISLVVGLTITISGMDSSSKLVVKRACQTHEEVLNDFSSESSMKSQKEVEALVQRCEEKIKRLAIRIRQKIILLGYFLRTEQLVELDELTEETLSFFSQDDLNAYLVVALFEDNCEAGRLLLDKGADANLVSRYDQPLLLCALKKGYLDFVELLIEHKADVAVRDMQGRNVLMKACEKGFTVFVQKHLLDESLAFATDSQGHTALSVSVGAENDELCELLIPLYKKRIDLINHALYVAVQMNKRSLVEMLVKHADVEPSLGHRSVPIMAAVMNDSVDLVSLLLYHYPQLDVVDENGNTVLILAAQRWNEELCKLIVGYIALLRKSFITVLMILKYRLPHCLAAKVLYRQREALQDLRMSHKKLFQSSNQPLLCRRF